MKKFLLIMAAILLLCACNSGTPEQPEIPEQEEQPISETESGEEKPSAKQLTIKKHIEEDFFADYSVYGERKMKLDKLGITLSISNIEVQDDRNWTATLTLKREEFELPIDISGIHILLEGTDYSWNEYYWGTFLFTGNGNIVFCGKEKVLFFDEYNLEPMDVEFELPKNENGETWVNGAAYVPEKEAFYLFTSSVSENSADENVFVSKCDLDGKIIDERKTKVFSSGGFEGKFYPYFMEKSVIFEYEGLVFVNNGNSFCGIGNEKIYSVSKDTEAETENYIEIEIYTFYNEDYGKDFWDGNKMAFLYEAGNLIDCFPFKETNLSVADNIEDEISFFGDGEKYIYYSDHFAMTLELDFENKIHKLSYNPTDKHTGGGIYGIKSPDGKFTICTFGETSGGDAFYVHTAIRNNETGKYVYIGESGGIWGGSGGNGFFKNNDFYSWTSHELTVLDPETGKLKFELGKNFPMGYDEETDSERGILTFRRDPNDMTFIIVYYEYENGFEWKEVEPKVPGNTSHQEGNCNYKIGFLDAEGNLLASYDTGMPIWGEMVWGLHSVDMFYSAEDLTLTLTVKNVGKGNSGFVGVFDMGKKEFTVSE